MSDGVSVSEGVPISDGLEFLHQAHEELAPRFKALRAADAALRSALRLASAEKADALPMHKALVKLKDAAAQVDSPSLQRAVVAFEEQTQTALDALAFDFAKDLKESFAAKGINVAGRPPTLVIDPLVLSIDIAGRKAMWFYGKEALSRRLTLSIGTILKAYEQAHKEIVARQLDDGFLAELRQAYHDVQELKTRRDNRANIMEVYGKLVLNRQSKRFWNAPSSQNFKDYPRHLFVRDLLLVQRSERFHQFGFRLAGATKSQAENANRSIWLPSGPLEGEYYADIIFD